MAKRARLDSRSAREKLKPRGAPYWAEAGAKVDLGYRRIKAGVGSWVMRRYVEETRTYVATTFARADDLDEADGVDILTLPSGAGQGARAGGGGRRRGAAREPRPAAHRRARCRGVCRGARAALGEPWRRRRERERPKQAGAACALRQGARVDAARGSDGQSARRVARRPRARPAHDARLQGGAQPERQAPSRRVAANPARRDTGRAGGLARPSAGASRRTGRPAGRRRPAARRRSVAGRRGGRLGRRPRPTRHGARGDRRKV